jgi:ankyrin repeat protein
VHLAIIWEHSEIAQYLLSQNADPDLPDENGRTPLWVAAELRDLKVVRMLVAAKVDIHSFDNQKKWTALHAAYDSPETVHILLEQGADINRLSEQGNTPLDLAIWNNFPKVIETMLKESKNKPDLSLTSTHVALWSAVDRGYSEVVSLMLEAGADVNFIDEDNMPLASTAMWLSDDVMIRTILEYCPDLSMKDNNGDTALHYIGNKTPDTSVRLVVNAGGKLDTFNNDKATPLICAIRKQNMDAFTYLLTKKLVVDTLNITAFKDAGTPLHIACEMGTLEMVKSLIKNGSDINFTCTSWYGTPLIAATFRIRRFRDEMGAQIIKLLLDEGADPSLSAGLFGYPIIAASLSWPTHVVQWFLDRKASIDVKDAFGRKPAHSACYNSLKVLNALQVPDADFAVKDLVGRVPLHYAVLSGQLDLVEEVLARSERVGVGIDVRDNDGWTPLLWAARASRVLLSDEKEASAHVAVVSFLLDKKADPTIHGSGLFRDWTASEVAYYHNADRYALGISSRTFLKTLLLTIFC